LEQRLKNSGSSLGSRFDGDSLNLVASSSYRAFSASLPASVEAAGSTLTASATGVAVSSDEGAGSDGAGAVAAGAGAVAAGAGAAAAGAGLKLLLGDTSLLGIE